MLAIILRDQDLGKFIEQQWWCGLSVSQDSCVNSEGIKSVGTESDSVAHCGGWALEEDEE